MNALPALLLCALAGCGTSDKVELRFAPAEGSRVRRTIEVDHLVLRTLDQYLKVGDGRPLLLRRQFEEIRMDDQQVSQLSGTSVVFTWVPEEGTYGKYYDARESSESTLRDLPEDLDLRALLPASPVAVGDSWSMPVGSLRDMLAPPWLLDRPPEKGECKLVLESVRQEAGRRVATIAVRYGYQHGTLVWDLGAGRASSLSLEGRVPISWRIEDAAPQGQK